MERRSNVDHTGSLSQRSKWVVPKHYQVSDLVTIARQAITILTDRAASHQVQIQLVTEPEAT